MGGRLIFRMSLAREFNYVAQFAGEVQGVIVDAHIVELYANSLGAFLSATKLPYFVDPGLHRFMDPFFSDQSEKRWVEPLSKAYQLDKHLDQSESGLKLSTLSDSKVSKAVAKGAVEYQRSRLQGAASKIADLATLLGEPSPPVAGPEGIIAPYLLIEDPATIPTNLQLLKSASECLRPGEELWSVVAVSQEILDTDELQAKVLAAFAGFETRGVFVWVIDSKDWAADSSRLDRFSAFLYSLRKACPGRKIGNLYGGYYSTVLSARGLLDVSSQGVGIGEYKDPYLTGGGWRSRYYVPVSHQLVSTENAEFLRLANSGVFGCTCKTCSKANNLTELKAEGLAQHFIRTRINEHRAAASGTVPQLVKKLSDDSARVAAVKGGVSTMTASHAERLQIWADRIGKDQVDGRIT